MFSILRAVRHIDSKRQWLVAITVLLAVTCISVPSQIANSQQDEAQSIYQLARALHSDDLDNQNYTYWVNGNIGKDIGLPELIVVLGEPMPDFTFKSLNSTDTLDSSKLESAYILNFWASWCGPCREEFPLLLQAVENKQFTMPVYFVDTFDEPKPALEFLKELDVDSPVFTDTAKSTFAYTNMQSAVPQTFLIDADGNIQALHVGNMTPAAINFFAEIATHPGLGAFDAANPDQMPAISTAEATSEVTITPTRKASK